MQEIVRISRDGEIRQAGESIQTAETNSFQAAQYRQAQDTDPRPTTIIRAPSFSILSLGRAIWRLAQYRDLLEPGRSVVITVSAEDRPEGVNLRINSVQSLEDEASRIQKALRIFVRDDGPSSMIQSQLKQRGDSQVSIIVLKGEAQGEVEISLGSYRVSPQIASAMRAVQGVVEVELV